MIQNFKILTRWKVVRRHFSNTILNLRWKITWKYLLSANEVDTTSFGMKIKRICHRIITLVETDTRNFISFSVWLIVPSSSSSSWSLSVSSSFQYWKWFWNSNCPLVKTKLWHLVFANTEKTFKISVFGGSQRYLVRFGFVIIK